MSNSCFIFLLVLLLDINVFSIILSIPFKFKFISYYLFYNSTNFLNDYIKKDLILEFNIGTPPQKVKAIINQDSSCFLIRKQKLTSYYYSPKKSSSFTVQNKVNEYSKSTTYEDLFNFQEINKTLKLSFQLENNSNIILNNTYLPIIGLNIPLMSFGRNYLCPNIILDLKTEGITNKIIWTLKYKNKYEGELIIGNDLFVYDPIKYPNYQYSTIYFNTNYSIFFESISTQDKWYKSNYSNTIINNNNNNSKFKYTDVYININYGLIIGTNEFKNHIDNIFFKKLIDKNICKLDLIKYISNDENDKKFSDNDYYIYSCYKLEFTGQRSQRHPTINYYNEFPNLIFSSKKLEYNFILTNEDLFELISGRYYFLIIFKKNNNTKEKEEWYLGEPFYKKYIFSVNLEAKTMGFYINKERNINNVNDSKNNDNQNNITQNDERNNNILKYIIEIIIIIGLLFISYYIGVTVRERRRKRANELKDDNYEYLPEKNKNINKHSNDINKQFIELNSKLGL